MNYKEVIIGLMAIICFVAIAMLKSNWTLVPLGVAVLIIILLPKWAKKRVSEAKYTELKERAMSDSYYFILLILLVSRILAEKEVVPSTTLLFSCFYLALVIHPIIVYINSIRQATR